MNHSFLEPIWVLVQDLSYQPRPDKVIEMTRERYAKDQLFYRRKGNILLERITIDRACQEEDRIRREMVHAEYDRRIQEKYNVGPGWENNRWFVEQVRPTI